MPQIGKIIQFYEGTKSPQWSESSQLVLLVNKPRILSDDGDFLTDDLDLRELRLAKEDGVEELLVVTVKNVVDEEGGGVKESSINSLRKFTISRCKAPRDETAGPT